MLLRLAVKTGIAGGFIYYTIENGVWGKSTDSEKLYNNIKKSFQPQIESAKKKLPFTVPPLPKTGEIRFLAKHYYNQGVKSTIRFIYMLPCYTGQLIKKSKDSLNKAIEGQK